MPRQIRDLLKVYDEDIRRDIINEFNRRLADSLSGYRFESIRINYIIETEEIGIGIKSNGRWFEARLTRQSIENINPDTLFNLIVDNFKSQLAFAKKDLSTININVKLGDG